jgi:glycosyltransferase involved in cell wall biosynthesis
MSGNTDVLQDARRRISADAEIRRRGLPRLAVISHSAVEPSYRAKWRLVARAGWDVLLLLPEWWPEAGRHIRARAGRAGRLRVEVVRGIATGRLARWTPLGLRRKIGAFRPDLVYAEEEPYGMSCWLAARAARALGVRFAFFTWENVRRRYGWPQERMIAAVLRSASGAIAGNAEAARILRRRGFRRPVAVIPQYGFDPGKFRPRPRAACRRALGWPAEGRIAGYVGRLVPEKGIETLIRAVHGLPEWRAAIVGSGPHSPALRALAAGRLGGRALFLGAVPRARVAGVMGALDVLVLPSRTTPVWKEQFGRVLAEALAAGRWALGSSSGAIPSVLGDRRLVFREGDDRALAARLRAVGARRPPAGLRRRAVRVFSDRAVTGATESFLRKLAGTG